TAAGRHYNNLIDGGFFMERFKNLINGKLAEPKTGQYFKNINPADKNEVIGEFPSSGKEDIQDAVKAARAAFPVWSGLTPPKRADIIRAIIRKLRENKDELAYIIVREMGKTTAGALGEVKSSIDAAEFAAAEGQRMYGQTTYSSLEKRWVVIKRTPVGVCGLITAWNAPLAIIAWKLFPALICGNTIVLKPAEDTPLSAYFFGNLLKGTGLPDGVINIVHGIGEQAGKALIDDETIDIMSFTGSSEVGSIISDVYGNRMKKCSLELGGKNGLFVMDDADLDVAADAVAAGAFSCAGQRCASTSRVIAHEKIYDALLEKIIKKTKNLKIGPGTDDSNKVNPVINEKQLNNIKSAIDKAKTDGAELILGGSILKDGIYSNGYYIEPAIFVNVDPNSDLAQKEIFGPVLAVFKCKNYEEGIKLINSTEYGLTASIHTLNFNLAMDAMDRIHAGVCYVNAPTFGSEAHIPFGGVKKSGNGQREPGNQALDVFSEWKTIYLDYSQVNQNSQFSCKN
ncbi:aldehyde dehydrogenase family protein, partial [bacterium]